MIPASWYLYHAFFTLHSRFWKPVNIFTSHYLKKKKVTDILKFAELLPQRVQQAALHRVTDCGMPERWPDNARPGPGRDPWHPPVAPPALSPLRLPVSSPRRVAKDVYTVYRKQSKTESVYSFPFCTRNTTCQRDRRNPRYPPGISKPTQTYQIRDASQNKHAECNAEILLDDQIA